MLQASPRSSAIEEEGHTKAPFPLLLFLYSTTPPFPGFSFCSPRVYREFTFTRFLALPFFLLRGLHLFAVPLLATGRVFFFFFFLYTYLFGREAGPRTDDPNLRFDTFSSFF